MAEEREYDLIALLDGNVDSITPKLGELSYAQLAALKALEKATRSDKPRSTLIDAIDGEIEARDAAAEGFADEKVRQAQADAKAAHEAKAEADAKASAKDDEIAARDATIQRLTEELAHAKAAGAIEPGKSGTRRAADARTVEFGGEGEAAGIVFTAPGGTVIEALPALSFAAHEFITMADGGEVLDAPISLPATGPRVTIGAAVLLDDSGKGIGISRMMTPLQVGGGLAGSLPARSLKFMAPAGAVPRAVAA